MQPWPAYVNCNHIVVKAERGKQKEQYQIQHPRLKNAERTEQDQALSENLWTALRSTALHSAMPLSKPQ